MKRILLIEDNLEMRENTAEILELAGYDVDVAEHGKAGVQAARDSRPDLIICDVMMPELDGFGVLRILSKTPGTAGIPFVFLTAKSEKGDFRKGMNLGADDYLTKPFEESELLDVVELRMKKHENLEQSINGNGNGGSIQHFLQEAKGMGALEALSADCESRIYRPKDQLIVEGSYPRYLLYVVKGKGKQFKLHEEGKAYITGWYQAGDFLGYTTLLQESPFHETVEAVEETEVLLIPKSDFLALMYNNLQVSHQFIKLLSKEVESKEEELLHLAYDTVRKRVADALLKLQDQYQEEKDETFAMAISRENLASMVGTSKECVIRVLSEFKSEGIVKTQQSEIQILNPDRLRAIRW